MPQRGNERIATDIVDSRCNHGAGLTRRNQIGHEAAHRVDSRETFERVNGFVRQFMPELAERIEATSPSDEIAFTQPIQMRFNELIGGVRGDLAVKVYGDDFGKMLQTAQQLGRITAEVLSGSGA